MLVDKQNVIIAACIESLVYYALDVLRWQVSTFQISKYIVAYLAYVELNIWLMYLT
jgi:hypothetical protein